ncbi:nitrite reductase, copper-containing [Thermobaculum terrenum ATCC BAA-798]|uniref:Copper-containing nitrite reductase n=1 Tax=Thermobaculum terrenum (strain ATCC BAA-798 / CCMEE 7001 / YNP1) TaxID=525904 RepID=D1CH29_THET1|nr:copper-containing nitrite reductase [Thermobaculum terrenum]ACZ43050.1 nitrite reductase, copper-containing [Thermobaculum terrenum ATCC BAA-798]
MINAISKKTWTWISILVVLALVLAACGASYGTPVPQVTGYNEQTGAPPTPTPTLAPSPSPSPSPSPTPTQAAGAQTDHNMHMGGQGSADQSVADLQRLPLPKVAPPVGDRPPKLVKVYLETKEVRALIDDNVPYTFWTFNGTVPGPMIRVRVGDTVEITLKNSMDSKMYHSIDLHAVNGPGGGSTVTQVGPGQTAVFRFKALNPGVYIYHCATPPVPEHIANGMYGLVVVEPAGGLPKVDREFYVMQGDFYVDNGQFSLQKMLDENPTYVVFNGSVGSLQGSRALQAKVGDRVRIFFGVGGPNLASSFHVIGEIFDRVAPEGATTWEKNVGVTLVPAGGTAMVEFRLNEPGDYTLVDHSIGRTMKGAVGTLHVEGKSNPSIYRSIKNPNPAMTGGHGGSQGSYGSEQSASSQKSVASITVRASEFKFEPSTIKVQAGKTTRVTFINNGVVEHDLEVKGLKADEVKVLGQSSGLSQQLASQMQQKTSEGVVYVAAAPKQQTTIEFKASQEGTYQVACTVPGHEQAGMHGELVVSK